RVVRMQRGQRVLEDHGHLAAAQFPDPARAGGDQVLAVQPDVPGDLGLGPLVQSHDAHAGDALAGTRLPHDAQRAAAFQDERDSVHGPDQAVVGLEVDPQVADVQQRRHQNRTLGSTTAYRMSTIMLAMTMKKDAIMTTPMISGRSWFWIARMVNCPRPGKENVVSVRMAPPRSRPRSRPKIVTMGVSAARSPCLTTTRRSR